LRTAVATAAVVVAAMVGAMLLELGRKTCRYRSGQPLTVLVERLARVYASREPLTASAAHVAPARRRRISRCAGKDDQVVTNG
jgi:hypothetical protein